MHPILILLLTLTATSSLAIDVDSDYARISIKLEGTDPRIQAQHARMLDFRDKGDYKTAIDLAKEIVNLTDELSAVLSIPRINLALMLAGNRENDQAIIVLNRLLERMTNDSGPYSAELIRPLLIRSLIEQRSLDATASLESLRRAQHLIHRHDGVYSPQQQLLLDQLTLLHIRSGNMTSANREQSYSYKISSVEFGEGSLEMIPAMEKYAGYLKDTGQFKESVDLYREEIAIIENEHGNNNIRLVEPLKGIADVRVLQKEIQRYGYATPDVDKTNTYSVRLKDAFGQAYFLQRRQPVHAGGGEVALERIVSIINESPTADISDQALALVELGDMYIITGDSRAADVYVAAWQMLQANEELADLSNEIFGLPTRILPGSAVNLPILKVPQTKPYFARAELTVRPNGRTGDVHIIDANIPNDERRMLKHRLFLYRYRPRMVNGKFVATKNISVMQRYHGIGKIVPVYNKKRKTTDADKEAAAEVETNKLTKDAAEAPADT